MKRVHLKGLGFDEGGHLLVKRALSALAVDEALSVEGAAPTLGVHLRGWCRALGHGFEPAADGHGGVVRRGAAEVGRWRGALRAGAADEVAADAAPHWGLAARGSTVEAGVPEYDFALRSRAEAWASDAPRLYAQGLAAQWDPATAVPWDAAFELDPDIEDAVVQVMTYLIENETAALVVPARFASQMHPHYREVMQLLALQAADEARHIEVFTRRALLKRDQPGLSTAGGQASLKTLVDERDFAEATLLLSVLGEGSFLSLLHFLHQYGPDPITREISRLAAQDEARHVAFGLSHLAEQAADDDQLLDRLEDAIRRRHDVLAATAGLNEEVFDALVLIGASGWDPDALRQGWRRVQELELAMHAGRRSRLVRLGYADERAEELASLHTRNFM